MVSKNKTEKPVANSDINELVIPSATDFNDLNETDIVKSYIGKRMRNLRKKKEKLDKYQSIADGKEEGILNNDQKSALLNKEGVTIPISDLEKISALYDTRTDIWKAELIQEKIKYEEKLKQQTISIKKQVEDQAKEKLDYLLKFLRAASYRRDVSSSSENVSDIDSSLEHLLTVVYEADEASHAAIGSLYEGSEDLVFDQVANPVTFSVVKDMCTWSPGRLLGIEESPVETVIKSEVNHKEKPSKTSKKSSSTPEILFIHQSEITPTTTDDGSRQESGPLSHSTQSQVSVSASSSSTQGANKEKDLLDKKKNQKRSRSAKKKLTANDESGTNSYVAKSADVATVSSVSPTVVDSTSINSDKQQGAEKNRPRRNKKPTNGEPKKGGQAKDKETKPSSSSKPQTQKPKNNGGKESSKV